jgi:hypothetical protein
MCRTSRERTIEVHAARLKAIAGAENSGSLADTILCRCTIIAAAKSGVKG